MHARNDVCEKTFFPFSDPSCLPRTFLRDLQKSRRGCSGPPRSRHLSPLSLSPSLSLALFRCIAIAMITTRDNRGDNLSDVSCE
jgi:hypothetical protein